MCPLVTNSIRIHEHLICNIELMVYLVCLLFCLFVGRSVGLSGLSGWSHLSGLSGWSSLLLWPV